MAISYIPVDILAFGAHPDDVELGCAGTLLKAHVRGQRTAVVDLTRGEMASRGTAEERDVESARAAELLGVSARRNLNLGDGRLMDTQEHRDAVAAEIRRFQPKMILMPYPGDRHPDHDAAGHIIQAAVFYARMKNRVILDCNTGDPLDAHSPGLVLIYPMHELEKPTFIVDISAVHTQKMDIVRTYRSQFLNPMPDDYQFIGANDYIHMIEARGAYYGSMIQAAYGEPFIARSPLKIDDPLTSLGGGKAGL
ncbi:MAG TPA: bacillithiol biosynthesis deacetylase BshB1 [Armatimonadota bacterium]